MIVLTGGAGFIGSCFLKKLNNEGISDILVVDHLGNGLKWKNLIGKKFRDYIHKDTFREKLRNNEYGASIDFIVHFGACSSTTEKNLDYLMDNNYSYSKDLAEYAERNDIRMIYASSAATYGDGFDGYDDGVYDTLKPLNGYGFSKHIFDLWLRENGLINKFTGLKFFNVFGPNEYHKGSMSSMVFKSFHQIKNTGQVNLFKSYIDGFDDGEQKRDFIYVKDAVDVVWKLFNNDSVNGIFNLGNGEAKSWNDLIRAVFKALDLEPKIEYIEMPDELKNQYQYFTLADMHKLQNSNINHNFMSLDDSVYDYVNNHLSKNFPFY